MIDKENLPEDRGRVMEGNGPVSSSPPATHTHSQGRDSYTTHPVGFQIVRKWWLLFLSHSSLLLCKDYFPASLQQDGTTLQWNVSRSDVDISGPRWIRGRWAFCTVCPLMWMPSVATHGRDIIWKDRGFLNHHMEESHLPHRYAWISFLVGKK